MSVPTDTMSPTTAGSDVPNAPAQDYVAMRQEYEEHERMSAILQQMCELNFQVEVLSEKYFPGGITFTLEPDPEIADAYFVVHGKVSGTVEEIVAIQNAWIGELWDKLRAASRFYRLSLSVHEAP